MPSPRRFCPGNTRSGRWCGTTAGGPPGCPFRFTRSDQHRQHTRAKENVMIGQLKDLLVHTGASWVIWLLATLSVVSIGAMLDPARVLWRQRADFATLSRALHPLLATAH